MGRSIPLKDHTLTRKGKIYAKGRKFILGTENIIGPGHAGITEISEYGLLFSFHYYDGERDGEHALGIREIYFEDGYCTGLGIGKSQNRSNCSCP